MTEPKSGLQVNDDAAAAVAKTPNRISLKDLQDKISSIEFINPKSAPLLTIAVVLLTNGYTVTGESAAADSENHNAELGRKIAEERAIAKIWPLEGYLLRERLSAAGK